MSLLKRDSFEMTPNDASDSRFWWKVMTSAGMAAYVLHKSRSALAQVPVPCRFLLF
jgi:hypothetical protein